MLHDIIWEVESLVGMQGIFGWEARGAEGISQEEE
jgi:hypothetical protein